MKKQFRHLLQPASLFIALIGLGLGAFQNCSKVDFGADIPSVSEFSSNSLLTINNGAKYTNSSGVSLQIKTLTANEMYVTNDSTCASGGSWEPYATERPWVLGQKNAEAHVFVKFNTKSGAELPCINASIIHDDTAPTADIVNGPAAYSNASLETLGLEGQDALSGIDSFECRSGSSDFKKCDAQTQVSATVDGPQTFQARAVDRAGNRSKVVEHAWLRDTVPPVLNLVDVPASPSARSYATIRMEVEDPAGGSGIDRIRCQWDMGSVKNDCSLSESNTNLANGTHTFTAWAIDKAGNESQKESYQWVVNTAPSGEFEVIGVTGGTDVEKDNLLGTVLTPTTHWSVSSGAVNYKVSVLNQQGQVVCAEKDSAATSYSYSSVDCTLVDGHVYSAKVVAINNLGVARTAPLFQFTVDVTPPAFQITGPIDVQGDQKTAKFNFTITDASGIRDATCSKTYLGASQSANCKDLTTYTYTNLPNGDHVFQISATDKAGNKGMSQPISWKVQLVICDPFNSVEGGCKKGLKGNLYYLTGNQLDSPYKDVESYIKYGKVADAIVYMSQLFVPTRSFSEGFSTNDQNVVTDDSGQKLVEYFALEFETLMKLGPNDQPGFYQFGILSDDGSLVEIKDSPTGSYRSLIDNDGTHSTRFGCDKVGMSLDANSRIPMRIKYYQGPRTEIALHLVWRKLDSETASTADTACGKTGTSTFYGNDLANPDLVNYEFGKMVKRGWKTMAPENFILQEEAAPAGP